jgi:hypothetical protein
MVGSRRKGGWQQQSSTLVYRIIAEKARNKWKETREAAG